MTAPTVIAIVIGGFLLLVFALVFLISYITYAIAFKRQRKPTQPYDGLDRPSFAEHRELSRSLIDNITSVNWEEVSIIARDGTHLSALYFRQSETAPLQIMCHGYKSHPLKDMSGGGSEALKRGYNLLLVKHRAHHESGGRCLTFGALERLDVADWIDWHNEKYGDDNPIILVGISMGAATVILASALPLPGNVRCVIADCPYSSAEAILKKEIGGMHLPVSIFYPLMRLGARIYGGFRIEDACVKEAAKEKRLPLLLIHGEEDRFVPTDMSRKISEAASGVCELHTFPGAHHGTSYLTDPVGYMQIVDTFIKKYSGEAND